MKKTFKRILAGAMACALTIGISATAVAERPRIKLSLGGYGSLTGSISYQTLSFNNIVFTAKTQSDYLLPNKQPRAVPALYSGVVVSDLQVGGVIYRCSSTTEHKGTLSSSTYGMTQRPMVGTGQHNVAYSINELDPRNIKTTYIIFDM